MIPTASISNLICSHSVAIAECNNLLTEFLAQFQKEKTASLLFHCVGFLLAVARKVVFAPRRMRKMETTKHVDRLESTDTLSGSGAAMSESTIGNASPLAQVSGAS